MLCCCDLVAIYDAWSLHVVSCRVVCWGDAGKKDFSTDNDDVVFTAAREFHEETGGVLEAVLHALTTVQYSIMPDPVRTAATPGAAAGAAAGTAAADDDAAIAMHAATTGTC